MTELRISPDGSTVAQRYPIHRDDGLGWLSWVFLDGRVDVTLRTEVEVADWRVVWPTPGDDRAQVDIVHSDGSHTYWSTHCRHGNHDACSATELAPGVPRRPAQCKTCAAPCRCPCGHDRRR